MADYVLHGSIGTGAVAVEAALTLIGAPYELVDAGDWRDTAEAVAVVNPLRQQPTLIWTDGEGRRRVMTESAAILLWLAERHPEAGLAPPPGAPGRDQFLRWMVYLPAAIYALFWISDGPERLLGEVPGAAKEVRARIRERIADCWRMMDDQVEPAPWLAGERLSVLDLYVAVMSRWTPRRRRFYSVAPRMTEAIRRVDALPALQDLWARRFPFNEGWEG